MSFSRNQLSERELNTEVSWEVLSEYIFVRKWESRTGQREGLTCNAVGTEASAILWVVLGLGWPFRVITNWGKGEGCSIFT